MNQKKGQPFTRRFTAVTLSAECLALLIKNGRFEKSLRSVESFFPFFIVLLSFVKWHIRIMRMCTV
jgi:hypothetical protein